MNPLIPALLSQARPEMQQYGNTAFLPGIFASLEESNDFLASYDSDTRDYILKHTGEYCSKDDILKCISDLHKKS